MNTSKVVPNNEYEASIYYWLSFVAKVEGGEVKRCSKCQVLYVTSKRHKEDKCFVCSGKGTFYMRCKKK